METMFEHEEQQVAVAAGIIVKNGKVLICQRSINHRYGLKWEFPGGKPYPDEPLSECLTRELEEELDVLPTSYTPLRTLQADYPDGGSFLVTFFLIRDFEGDIQNLVFDNIAWVTLDELETYDLLEGSRPIIAHLKERLLTE
jgi:8-oxo-dGTP diphosphatase